MTEERWLVMPATQVKNHTQDQATTLIIHVPADFLEAWRNGSTPAVPPAPTGPASGTAAGGSGAVESGPHGRALNPGDEHAPPGSVCPGSPLRYRRLKGGSE